MRPIPSRALRHALIPCALIASVAPPLRAQIRFEERTVHLLPRPEHYTATVAAADIDGDGDLDLVRSGPGGTEQRVLRNDGSSVLTTAPASVLPQTYGSATFALGDVDGDGDADLIVGAFESNQGAQNQLYVNDGTGTFTSRTSTHMPQILDATWDVALCDVDGDRDLDVVVANVALHNMNVHANRLLLNDGSGRFSDGSGNLPLDRDITTSIACGDVDGDGDIDLVLGNAHPGSVFPGRAEDRLYINDGTGRFTDRPAQFPAPAEGTDDVAMADVDRDGDLDVVTASPTRNRLFLNNGSGTFLDASASHLPASVAPASVVAFVDLDRDGALEIVFGRRGAPPTPFLQNQVLWNTGNGVFLDATATALPVRADATSCLLAADFSGDGWADLFVGNMGPAPGDHLYLHDRLGRWLDYSSNPIDSAWFATQALAMADIDGDGDLDLATGEDDGQLFGTAGAPNRLYRNDGRGAFSDVSATNLPPDIDTTHALAFGDVDGDGDEELLVGNWGQDRLYLNTGGVFADATSAWLPVDSDDTSALALADFDRDGDLDLLKGNGIVLDYRYYFVGEQTRLYLNTGSSFVDVTVTHLPVDAGVTSGLAVGDVDGDGDLDAVLATVAGRNRLYANQGNGTFADLTATALPLDQDDSWDAALGDVDGDGDLDVTFANGMVNGRQWPTLYLNAGNGTFTVPTPARLPFTGLYSTISASGCAIADLDEDGDRDIVYSAWFSVVGAGVDPRFYPGVVLENDGRGFFRDVSVTSLPATHLNASSVVVDDVDGDLDVDVLFGGYGRRTLVLASSQRHVHAPLPARVGAPLELDFRAHPGSIAGFPVAMGVLSALGFDPPVPVPGLGALGVDLSTAIWLDPLPLGATGGSAIVRFRIPALRALAGRTFYYQALVFHAPQASTWRLANAGLAIIHP